MHNLVEKNNVVSGSFDDVRSHHLRFLEEAAKFGRLTVLLWSDEMVEKAQGHPPQFSLDEREYMVQAVRYVSQIEIVHGSLDPDTVPLTDSRRWNIWIVDETASNARKQAFCAVNGLSYHVVSAADTAGFPQPSARQLQSTPGKKKVIVTGCYDWLHSGHVRFFEEASAYGDLYVAVGNDANVRYLKGEGHPMFTQEERRYVVQAIRYVKQATITLGMGWMDAESNIEIIKPDIYLVNEDGDKPEKAQFCAEHNLEYVVLKRIPKEGLIPRSSTRLRGF
ncbi:MAG: adenylyltransferase/cytidyltransferase family protein [Anaerolineae bacterium]|nr:adenylyltransferase/cytidyltransferase family protein [Anaerolineae bacterium]